MPYSIKELANWVLDLADQRDQQLSNMSLNKLLYFAYEHALIRYGLKLTNAKIEAWNHGPVFREVYSSFKNAGSGPISGRASRYNPGTNSVEFVRPQLEPSDEQVILEAIDKLLPLPAYILREISHDARGAWSAVWNHKNKTNPGMEISDEIILLSFPTASSIQ